MKRIKLSKSRSHAAPLVRMTYALSSLIFILGSASLLAMSVSSPTMFQGLRASVMDVAAPVIQTVNAPIQKATLFFRDASGLASLQETNVRLMNENQQLQEWYLRAKTLENENAQLKTMLNFKQGKDASFITAEILTDTSSPFVKSMMVKAGLSDGLERGAPVISAQGVVGRIIESGQNASRVLLLTDMNSRIPVIVSHEGVSVQAVLAGQNDEHPVLLHVRAGQVIPDGAMITTSGMGGIYPRGLPVGTVNATAEKGLVVRPYMDPNAIGFLKVLMKDPASVGW